MEFKTMENKDNSSFYIIACTMTVVFIPIALIMYFILKSKAKKTLEEMYTIEKSLADDYDYYLKKRALLEHNKTMNISDQESLFNQFELLDDVANAAYLIKEKISDFDSKLFFVKGLSVMKVKDQILEKDYSKYRFNHDAELSSIKADKTKLYRHFESLNA